MLKAMGEIQTRRLILRAPQDNDPIPSVELIGDTAERSSHTTDPRKAKRWNAFLSGIGHWQMRGQGYYKITDRESGEIYGRCGLLRHEETGETQLSYQLYEGFEGNGYAFEAAVALRHHAGEAMDLPRLVSFIYPSNGRSRALAHRLGATDEGPLVIEGETQILYRHLVWDAPLARAQWWEVIR